MIVRTIVLVYGIVVATAATPEYGSGSDDETTSSEESTVKPWTDTRVPLHAAFQDLAEEDIASSDEDSDSLVPDLKDTTFPYGKEISSDSGWALENEGDINEEDEDVSDPLPYIPASEDEEVRRTLNWKATKRQKSSPRSTQKKEGSRDKPKTKATSAKPKVQPKSVKPKTKQAQEPKKGKKEQVAKKDLRVPDAKKSAPKTRSKTAPIRATAQPRKPRSKNASRGQNDRDLSRDIARKILRGRVVVRWREEPRDEIEPSTRSQLLLLFARLRKDVEEIEPVLRSRGSNVGNATSERTKKELIFNVMIEHPKDVGPASKEEEEEIAEQTVTQLAGVLDEDEEEEGEEKQGEGRASDSSDEEDVLPWQEKGHEVPSAREDAEIERSREISNTGSSRSQRAKLPGLARAGKRAGKPRRRDPRVSADKERKSTRIRPDAKDVRDSRAKRVPTIDHLIAEIDDALPVDRTKIHRPQNGQRNPRTSGKHRARYATRVDPRLRRKDRMRNHLQDVEHY